MKATSKYRSQVLDSNDPGYVNRILVFTPSRGSVRMEWVGARYGQIIPTNWGMVQYTQFIDGFMPLRYSVANAQNIAVKEVVEKNYEWLLMIEDDTIPPPELFVKINEYMIEKKEPVVSGLYFTKSDPSEPLIYRGRGKGAFKDWKFGDMVRADGVPTGCLLIHSSILKKMWEDSPEYLATNVITRRVFKTPTDLWYSPDMAQVNTVTGTSDLDWCTRVIDGGYLEKAGWPKHQKMQYPFLVDTTILCMHITPDGQQYPKHTTVNHFK